MSKLPPLPKTPPPKVPTSYQLEQSVSLWEQIRAGMIVDDPLFVPDEDIIETLIESAGHTPPVILLGKLIDATIWAERNAQQSDELRQRYTMRRDRYARRAEGLRNTINQLMEVLACTAAEGELGSASYVRPRAKVVVPDVNLLPEEYIKRTDPEPKKLEIANAIRGGKDVPGATMSTGNEPPALRITAY